MRRSYVHRIAHELKRFFTCLFIGAMVTLTIITFEGIRSPVNVWTSGVFGGIAVLCSMVEEWLRVRSDDREGRDADRD